MPYKRLIAAIEALGDRAQRADKLAMTTRGVEKLVAGDFPEWIHRLATHPELLEALLADARDPSTVLPPLSRKRRKVRPHLLIPS